MFHATLGEIIKAPRFGKALAGGYEVTMYEGYSKPVIMAYRIDKKDDPFPTANGGYSKDATLEFAPTVDVYIDETDGYAVPFKALDGQEYAMHFFNKDDQPLQPKNL